MKTDVDAGRLSRQTGVAGGVGAFLALAFGLAWLPFLPVLFGGPSLPPLLMPFAPAIACVVVRRWITREGFADAGLRLDLRQHLPCVALAAAWPLATAPLSVMFAVGLGLAPDGLSVAAALREVDLVLVLTCVAATVVAAPIFMGEELGWRGYLQIRILPGQPGAAAVVTGLIWGVWHYPLMLSTYGLTREALTMIGIFTVATTYASLFLGWLRARTGSVWTSAWAHSANNTAEDPLTRSLHGGPAAPPLGPAASIGVLLAEAGLLFGVVAAARARRRLIGVFS